MINKFFVTLIALCAVFSSAFSEESRWLLGWKIGTSQSTLKIDTTAAHSILRWQSYAGIDIGFDASYALTPLIGIHLEEIFRFYGSLYATDDDLHNAYYISSAFYSVHDGGDANVNNLKLFASYDLCKWGAVQCSPLFGCYVTSFYYRSHNGLGIAYDPYDVSPLATGLYLAGKLNAQGGYSGFLLGILLSMNDSRVRKTSLRFDGYVGGYYSEHTWPSFKWQLKQFIQPQGFQLRFDNDWLVSARKRAIWVKVYIGYQKLIANNPNEWREGEKLPKYFDSYASLETLSLGVGINY